MKGGPTAANTAALKKALAGFPDAQVETRDEFKAGQLSNLDTVLNVLYALLGLSVIVSMTVYFLLNPLAIWRTG